MSEELLAAYEDIKLRHKHKVRPAGGACASPSHPTPSHPHPNTVQYIVFGLKQIGKVGNQTTYGWEVTHKADPVADDKNLETFAAVVKSMPTDAPCFVVFDFVDTKSDGRQIKKLLLIKWCPDSVNFRIKPVIGASYQTLKCVATRGGSRPSH